MDLLRLDPIDANLNAAGDQAFTFIGTNADFSAAGQICLATDAAGNTIIEGNMDNNFGAGHQLRRPTAVIFASRNQLRWCNPPAKWGSPLPPKGPPFIAPPK